MTTPTPDHAATLRAMPIVVAARLEALLPELEFSRHTHVLWRDTSQASRNRNPDIGDAAFHDKCVADYDERISAIKQAINVLTTLADRIAALEAELSALKSDHAAMYADYNRQCLLVQEYVEADVRHKAEREALVAGLRDMADNGLRFDLIPTHDMTDQQSSEQFWHGYARQMDADLRERARRLVEVVSNG